MLTPKEWNKQLYQHRGNADWFRANSQALYSDLTVGLNQAKRRENYLQVLLRALPFIPMESKITHWRNLVLRAVDYINNLEDQNDRSRALNAIGFFHLEFQNFDDAQKTFNTAYDIAYANDYYVEQVEVLIGMLLLQSQMHIPGLEHSSIPEILTFHARWRTPELTARLHQAIAAACNDWRVPQDAISYARLSYGYWRAQDNHLEVGRTAFILSTGYRLTGEFELARKMLEQAADSFAKTSYVWQHSAIAHEMGCQLFYEGNYKDGLQWLLIAWEEARSLDDPKRHQVVLHSLGIVRTMIRDQMNMAFMHLQQALDLAYELGHKFDIAHIHHSLAFYTARTGDFEAARQAIVEGLVLANEVEQEPQRKWLTGRFEELRTMLDNDDPRLHQ